MNMSSNTYKQSYLVPGIFLTIVWLPHCQLWAIIEKAASFVQSYPHENINRCLTDINRCLTDIFRI